jgi:hypothetical protein
MTDQDGAQVGVSDAGRVFAVVPVLGHHWEMKPWAAATLARQLLAAVADSGQFGECAGCHAPVFWARDAQGHPRPLDIGDWPGAPAAASRDNGGLVIRYLSKAQPIREGEVPVMPHHATCPKADQFRKRTPARAGGRP